MASENTVFYEKLAEAIGNYPCLYDKSRPEASDDFKVANKKAFCVSTGYVTKHSQVSEINASVIRKLWVKTG